MAGSRDSAQRVRATRGGRDKGCRVYISKDQLAAAGFDPDGPLPWYRVWPQAHSKNTGRAVVSLYREA